MRVCEPGFFHNGSAWVAWRFREGRVSIYDAYNVFEMTSGRGGVAALLGRHVCMRPWRGRDGHIYFLSWTVVAGIIRVLHLIVMLL